MGHRRKYGLWLFSILKAIVSNDRAGEDVGGEVDDGTDDDDRGGGEFGRFDLVQDGVEFADELGLVGVGAPADQSDRGFGAESGGDDLGKDLGEVVDAHVNDEGFGALGDGAPVDSGAIFFGAFVTCDKGDAGAVIAVGEGNACVGRGCDAGGDAGDNFDADAQFG